MWHRRIVFVVMLCAVASLAACGGRPSGLSVAGSTSAQPLTEVLAEAYVAAGGERVRVQGGGSTAGVHAVLAGVADLAAVSRTLSAEETRQGLKAHIIAYDVLTIIVHPANPVSPLTTRQVRAIFAGEIRDWAGVGSRGGRIHVISREAGSGSREAFREAVGSITPSALVQGSAGAIRAAVAQDPQAIGYVSLGAAHAGGVRSVAVDGRTPGGAGYRLVRPIALVALGQPKSGAVGFVRFALSTAGQRLVASEGLVPVHAGLAR